MKKLLLILMLVPMFGISQARLGSTRAELFDEFAQYFPKFESPINGEPHMHFEMERALVIHYFNRENICVLSVISPKNQGDLNFFVEMYNNQYVIVSSTEWRMYSENGNIATVELVSNKGTTFFIWK
jgi:hypothetical protein